MIVIKEDTPEVLVLIEPDGRIRIDDIVLEDWEELVMRVKATLCLSAEDARAWRQVSRHVWGGDIPRACEALEAYANALEGDNG